MFGFHLSHVVMCVLIHQSSMGSTLADKVLKKTRLDLQKRFPIYHVCPKYMAERLFSLAFHQDLDEEGRTLFDW